MNRRASPSLLLLLVLVGCGGSPPTDDGYVPKIYAVEQQERAAMALRRGDESEAEAAATRAIADDPGFAPSYVTKATTLARRGDLAGAKAVLDACLVQQPGFAEALLLRGTLNEELKNPDAARADYEKAAAGYVALLAKDPGNADLVLKHAIAEYLRGGMAGLRAMNRMMEQFPDNARARLVRDRMEAQDRAFAFRWLTDVQPGAEAPAPAQ